jgi:hypothetical protein
LIGRDFQKPEAPATIANKKQESKQRGRREDRLGTGQVGARSGAKKQAASKLTEQNERLQEFKSAKENNDALGRKKESRTRGRW